MTDQLAERMVTAGAIAAIRASDVLAALADKPEIERTVRRTLAAALHVLGSLDQRTVSTKTLRELTARVEHPAEEAPAVFCYCDSCAACAAGNPERCDHKDRECPAEDGER